LDTAAPLSHASSMTNISRDELRSLLDTGDVIVVDTLGPLYYEAAHIPGAINIPHTDVDRLAPALLPDKSATIVTYCSNTACQNSAVAAARLRALGYTDVRRYEEGKDDWREAGLPLDEAPQKAAA
jgi:rhodanese-related sulfurtransferase